MKTNATELVMDRLHGLEKRLYLSKQILTLPEACAYLGIAPRTMYQIMKDKRISYSKPSKQVFFKLKDVIEYAEYGRVERLTAEDRLRKLQEKIGVAE